MELRCKNLKKIGKILFVILIFAACAWWGRIGKDVFLNAETNQAALILDAGHGGEDGGAVSLSGAKESDINLSVVLRMEQLLGFLGECPTLLRQEDISLHDDSAVTLREKKISDLKNRTQTANANSNATLVSIHQNTYPEQQYRGAQVFYAPTEGSRELAKVVQQSLTEYIQPENTRQEKQISDSVYLMNHIENRAILVECGFLSHPEEEQLLR